MALWGNIRASNARWEISTALRSIYKVSNVFFFLKNTAFFNSTIFIHLSNELYVKLFADTDGVIRINIQAIVNHLSETKRVRIFFNEVNVGRHFCVSVCVPYISEAPPTQ